MNKAFRKDIIRSIRLSRKRFISILAITALGVTVLTGIYAACQDMYYSSDIFYDEQNLFDIRIQSTLGLTDEDVNVLKALPGIAMAEGDYNETVHTLVEGIKQTVEMRVISTQGMNMPYVDEGVLPVNSGEIAVTQSYLDNSGKTIGDTIIIEEDIEEATEVAQEEETFYDWDAEVEIEEETETPNFLTTQYTITAVVTDPMNISNNEAAFRSSSAATDYTFFITDVDVESDIYTSVYLILDSTVELDCFSAEYEDAVDEMIKRIEKEIKNQREAARYKSVLDEARDLIEDAEAVMNEKFAEADQEIADAWDEIEEARVELEDGEATLMKEEKDAYQQLADARAELEEGRVELTDAQEEIRKGEEELAAARKELEDGDAALASGKSQYEDGKRQAEEGFAAAEQTMQAKQDELDASRIELEAGVAQMKQLFGDGWPDTEWNALADAAAAKTMELSAANPGVAPDLTVVAQATANEQAALALAVMRLGSVSGNGIGDTALIPDVIQSAVGMGVVNGGQQILTASWAVYEEEKAAVRQQLSDAAAEISKGQAQITDGYRQLEEAARDLENGKAEIADGWQELYDGEAQLNRETIKAKRQLADARVELEDGNQELADGEKELLENQAKYEDKKKEAEEKIADAYVELADIDMAKWYVRNRDSLDSYSSLKSDMSSIESIGGAFPIVFLIVAILISLTTMTRMVEEERGLIGTYKALGYQNSTIYFKYILYAVLACLFGGIVGDLLGFIALPKFLLMVLRKLYVLPNVSLRFDLFYGIGGILLFMLGIVAATIMVCFGELKQLPASLMRPKAPQKGSRVFLEKLPFIWNKMKFLNKVTVRNLFRYKKRFFMTVFGIMGCTALVLAGFAIKDSVTDLMPKQYDNIYQYDLMAVADADDNQELLNLMAGDDNVASYINMETGNFKAINDSGSTETVQLIVVEDGSVLEGYIRLPDTEGNEVLLDDSGILITQNAAELLEIESGDTVSLQNLDLAQGEAAVNRVVRNYLGNNAYITRAYYEELFGEYNPNGVLVRLSEECTDQKDYAESLLENDIMLSVVSIESIKEDFASNFALINAVVYVIIILAAGLAFAVLFTLSNTNISERIRELATTKVLGFYDREVHAYVNKETIFLTLLGILSGLPLGTFLSNLLTSALKMPSMYFAAYIAPVSYLYAAVISLCFALAVNMITNRTLNRINMVEALKSVE